MRVRYGDVCACDRPEVTPLGKRLWVMTILIGLMAYSPALAQRMRLDAMERGQREIGFGFAYGENHRIPSATKERRAFDQFKLRYGWYTSPTTELAVQFVNGRTHYAQRNAGVSADMEYRRYFSVRGDTAIGYNFTLGLTYFADGFTDQGTRFNFTEQIGLVWTQGLTNDSAFTLEYNFSHTSNAGIELPNVGLNASVIGLTYSWYP